MKATIVWITLNAFAVAYLVSYVVLGSESFFICSNVFLAASFLAISHKNDKDK
jgi:hypothetical protein